MKKSKFYLPMLALAFSGIVMSTASCVDDKESQSVTNMREANTELLKAEAVLARAEAAAKEILAKADAALIEAKAQNEAAQAKLKEAEAAVLAATTEAAKREAEAKAKKAEEEAKQQAVETERALKELEYALETIKLQALSEQMRLQQEMDNIAAQGNPILKQAYVDYANALNASNKLVAEIAEKDILLKKEIALEGDRTKTEEEVAQSIKRQAETEIKNVESSIKGMNVSLEMWNGLLTAGGGAENIEKQIAALEKQKNTLISSSVGVLENRQKAATVKNEAADLLTDFRNNGTVKNWLSSYMPGGELREVIYKTQAELSIELAEENKYLTYVKEELDKLEKELAKATANLETEYKAKETTLATLNGAYKKLDEAYENRDKVYADPTSTQAQKDAADNAVSIAVTAREAAINAHNEASDKYYATKDIVETYPTEIDSRKKNLIYWSEYAANLEEIIKDYDPTILEKAYIEAYEAWGATDKAYSDLSAEIGEISNSIGSLKVIEYQWQGNTETVEDIKRYIANLTNGITSNQERIAKLQRDIRTADEDAKEAIAILGQSIKDKQNEIVLLTAKKDIEDAKAKEAKKIINELTTSK